MFCTQMSMNCILLFHIFQIINNDSRLCMVPTINVLMRCLMIPIYVSDTNCR